MRTLLPLLLAFSLVSPALANTAGESKQDVTVAGSWQITTFTYIKSGDKSLLLELKSDNEVFGNNPERPEPLPLALSITCSKEQAKNKPVMTILYPNITFRSAVPTFTFLVDDKNSGSFAGKVDVISAGNNKGNLVSFDEKTTAQIIGAFADHLLLTVKIDGNYPAAYDGKFTIKLAAKALEYIKTTCGDK
jgi:hypothetical protein